MLKHAGGVRCLPQSSRQHSTSVSRARALPPPIHAGPRPGSIGVPARRRSTYDRGASPAPILFPPDNFKHSLTLFSKSFSSFPRGTYSLSFSRPYLSFDGIHRPIWAAFPNKPTRRQRLVVRQGPGMMGLSPSPYCRIPLVRTSSELVVRRAGKAPEGTVPSPSPGRHAATLSRRGISSSSPPIADGLRNGTPVPSPQSQSFSQTYRSILPTSLAYIVPSTRGCSPWRPHAVMSTIGFGRHLVLRIFKGLWERTGHHVTCGDLPAAGHPTSD
ncbi:Protein TAR1 [Capsicum baccatum]|uniref:Protein TAR1 n=1 Tax=Capsicum baccatum TaxID=33114 RepID=A0A2G2V285_CAPBA|nr:Protein TAR1 [Capsicum baccatum]